MPSGSPGEALGKDPGSPREGLGNHTHVGHGPGTSQWESLKLKAKT